MQIPNVVIAGGGPAGLLAALLLSQRGIKTTIYERAPPTIENNIKPLSSKSYSINLNADRGLKALAAAGPDVLSAVRAKGVVRNAVVIQEEKGAACGEQQEGSSSYSSNVSPVDPPAVSIWRPALVEALEQILLAPEESEGQDEDSSSTAGAKRSLTEGGQERAKVTICRGVAVSGVKLVSDSSSKNNMGENSQKRKEDEFLEVSLDDGSRIRATHLIGADGKWSNVRTSIPEWEDCFEIRTEPSWGIRMHLSSTPAKWRTDATHILRCSEKRNNDDDSTSKKPAYYIIATPMIGGDCHISIVCFDEILKEKPWMEPFYDQGDIDKGIERKGWNDEGDDHHTKDAFSDRLANMLRVELPHFYDDIIRTEEGSFPTANNSFRRASWLEVKKDKFDEVDYCALGGRVALIGDAAHAMTPSVGEGCNCALESAVELVSSICTPYAGIEKNGDGIRNDASIADDDQTLTGLKSSHTPTVENLSAAFSSYGRKRPKTVMPVQALSASRSRMEPKKFTRD